jgi:hypothetical protein
MRLVGQLGFRSSYSSIVPGSLLSCLPLNTEEGLLRMLCQHRAWTFYPIPHQFIVLVLLVSDDADSVAAC